MSAAHDRFLTTQWSVVFAAGEGASDRSSEALATLCELYWYPLYAFVRRRGYDPDAAQDLTQAFFARVIEKAYLRDATPTRGRFRSFLLGSLKHFLANEFDALKPVLTGEPLDETYAQLGERLGMSEGAVKVAVHRLRRRIRTLLQEEIARTVESPDDVEDEIQHLFEVLG
jgi:DNA-directed RNA polymerase specialized sigma24 family protein